MDDVGTLTMDRLLRRNAAEVGDRDFIVIEGSRLTYAGMQARAEQVAASLRGLGVRRGDTVAVLMPNCLTFMELLFGCLHLGAVCAPINARFQRNELRHVIPDCGASVVVVHDEISPHAEHLDRLGSAFPEIAAAAASDAAEPLSVADAPSLRWVVSMDANAAAGVLGPTRFAEAAHDSANGQAADRSPDGPAMMFYTSGTTSNPKGCVLTHSALIRVGAMTAQRFEYRDGDVMYDPLPMFHTAVSQPLAAMMLVRGTFVSQVFPDPDEAMALIAREGVTQAFTAFPTITEGILDHPAYDADTTLAGLKTLFNVAPPDAQRSIQSRLRHTKLVNAFGMTETAGSATMVRVTDPDDVRLTTQGTPMDGLEVEIRGEDGTPLPAGETGEIAIRGITLFGGYHNAPEKNEASFDGRGFWLSGDLGVLTEDGQLLFKGRTKDMLKVGGENVAAIEIESHLQTHPGVKIAQVVGYPDPTYGELPAAFIEPRAGHAPSEEELIDHCVGAIASFKVPRVVRFVTEWPMSSTKVQKFKLRDQLVQELDPAS
ncbi:class I adenylate-forming enzyme family protein [Euzebya tangerina]|uniref:class I adenylate-forming enzyme family protein n=1 Tax=Euzebya tangerina TaxID=591198 RepID=UPI000E32137D|nr:class I adenylate-forming enzyme family protein [Euzebya tangerina]